MQSINHLFRAVISTEYTRIHPHHQLPSPLPPHPSLTDLSLARILSLSPLYAIVVRITYRHRIYRALSPSSFFALVQINKLSLSLFHSFTIPALSHTHTHTHTLTVYSGRGRERPVRDGASARPHRTRAIGTHAFATRCSLGADRRESVCEWEG